MEKNSVGDFGHIFDTTHEYIGREEPKFPDDKTINNNSNNNSCREMRLIYALDDRANSSVTKM